MTDLLIEKMRTGPREGVEYPVSVNYCGNCTMPIEVYKFDFNYFSIFIFDFFSFVRSTRSSRSAKNGSRRICRKSLQSWM